MCFEIRFEIQKYKRRLEIVSFLLIIVKHINLLNVTRIVLLLLSILDRV